MTIHQNLIAGEWVGADGVKNINPSNTNDVIGEYARASVEDTKAAIAAAKAAFPAWSRSGILERHAILRKTADEILARKDELARLLSREEGKTLAEGIGETVRAGQIFDFFAGETLRLAGETLPSVPRHGAHQLSLPRPFQAAPGELRPGNPRGQPAGRYPRLLAHRARRQGALGKALRLRRGEHVPYLRQP